MLSSIMLYMLYRENTCVDFLEVTFSCLFCNKLKCDFCGNHHSNLNAQLKIVKIANAME